MVTVAPFEYFSTHSSDLLVKEVLKAPAKTDSFARVNSRTNLEMAFDASKICLVCCNNYQIPPKTDHSHVYHVIFIYLTYIVENNYFGVIGWIS